MKQKILHVIVTLLCIAALIRISVRCYDHFFNMQNVILLRKITMGLATLGWFVILGEELTNWRVTNWLIRNSKKFRK